MKRALAALIAAAIVITVGSSTNAIAAASSAPAETGIYQKVYIGGDIAYRECTNGTFAFTGDVLNGKPVYVKSGVCRGATWYLYFHNSRWAVSFNGPDQPDDGVTTGLASGLPWDAIWPGGALVTGVESVQVGGDIAYRECTNGTFAFTGDVLNGKPVYVKSGVCGGATWYLYFHNSRWAVSFNGPDLPDHGVNRGLASPRPWDAVWPGGAVVSR